MAQQMDEAEALRTHIKHLHHAVATTTCRRTVAMLTQMLGENEAKLREIETGQLAGNTTFVFIRSATASPEPAPHLVK